MNARQTRIYLDSTVSEGRYLLLHPAGKNRATNEPRPHDVALEIHDRRDAKAVYVDVDQFETAAAAVVAAVRGVSASHARIETPEDFERFSESVAVVARDDRPHDPLTVWASEDGDWFGIRPVSEDDGPWQELPAGVRETFAVPVTDIAPGDDFMPFTVLWSDGPLPALTAADEAASEPRRRLRACVEAWPECHTDGYDPRCCRFPKSCSASAYDPEHVTDADLEDGTR